MPNWIPGALRRFFSALAAVAFSVASLPLAGQTNADLIDEIESDTDRWIELQSALSKESARWESEKELLENSIRVLNTEKEVIEGSLESNRLASELYLKNQSSLVEEIGQRKAALGVASEVLSDYREKVESIIARLPEPIREEVAALAVKLDSEVEDSEGTVAGRMQSLISILAMVDQFNNSLTLTHQIREGANGRSFDTRVLYWGLSMGFAVDRSGELAWRLIPGEGGWTWEDASGEAASIKTLLDIYENDQRPSLVSLRAKLN